MAEAMRNMHPGSYLSAMQDIIGFADWDTEDAMKKFAIEQLQSIVKDGEIKNTHEEWECEGFGTAFQYLRHAGRKLYIALKKCPNCIETYEGGSDRRVSDKDMDDEVEDSG